MCRWILKTVFTDNLQGRRRRLVKFICQVPVIRKRKLHFWKLMCALQYICLFVSIKAKNVHVHWHTHTHTLPVLLLLKMLSAILLFFPPLKWKPAWRHETTSEEASAENSAKGDSPTGIKILQPVIFHLSYSSGIVLWSPLRGIKSGLINIIGTLMAAEQITTLSNH